MSLVRTEKRIQRHKRVRARVVGTTQVPRLCVFRSQNHIYAQLIDDTKGNTLLASSDLELKSKKGKKTEKAKEVGKLLAEKARERKIEKVIFDRGGYKYHGSVKALADGAREGGLKF